MGLKFTPECQKHMHWDYAGVYKRDKYGKIMKKKGQKVLLSIKETWACPHCNVVFIKPKHTKFKTRPLSRKKHGKLNNRTVSKVLR